jgi:hypothetical protein
MSDDIHHQVAKLWQGFRKRAVDSVTRQTIALVRNRVAGVPVVDDAGNLIVDAGHRIDDEVIERAQAAGKLQALVAAALKAKTQDLQEKTGEMLDNLPEHREARWLATAEEAAETRRYIGRIAGIDVTDVRGTVIVPAGKRITEEDVGKTREAGLLAALRYSAQQPQPEAPASAEPEQAGSPFGSPLAEFPPPRQRPTLPLLTPDEEEEGQDS